MPVHKVAITLDAELIEEVDAMVARRKFANRSRAIQAALREKLERMRRTRLAREAAKLVPKEERSLAEAFNVGDDSWPEY